MSEESEESAEIQAHEILAVRYSLKEMLAEVAIERSESVFGRELVNSSEIDKMFKKKRRERRNS